MENPKPIYPMTTQQTKGMPDKGSSQARVAAKQDRRKDEEALDVSTMSPEEFRLAKIAEALFERRRLDELRKASDERVRQERKFQH
jgi:hypothetical protein